MSVRAVWEMMSGNEQSAKVPAETKGPQALTAEPEARVGTVEIETATAGPEILSETGEAEAVRAAEPEAPQGSAAGAPVPAPQRTWTVRSRKNIRTEEALEKQLTRRNALKCQAEATLARLAEEKRGNLKLVIDGEGWADKALSDTLGKIEAETRELAVFTEEAAKAQADLDNYRAAMEAFAPERARVQDGLLQLAGARLEIDFELQRLLREARATLELREQLVSLMHEQAAIIDLAGDFSAGVPSSLHEPLSLEVVSAGMMWNARFCGEEEHLKAYVVCADSFEPETETLTRKARYSFGETVYLLEEEAAEFLRNDLPQPGGRGWECLPPILMTRETFQAVQAESGRTGPILKYVLQ